MFYNKFTKKDPVAEEIEKIISERWDDDDEDDDVKRADAELRRMKAKPIEADKKTDPDKEIGKLAKKTPKEVDEAVSAKDVIGDIMKTLNDPKELSKIKGEPKKWIGPQKGDYGYPHSAGHGMGSISGPKKEYGSKKESVEVKEDKWTDVADGPWKKSKRTPGQASSAAANAAGKGLKGAQHKLDVAEPKGKLTAADFKKLRKENAELSEKTLTPAESKKKEEIVKSMKKDKAGLKARYGKRWKEVAYATATKSAKRVAEDVEQIHESYKVGPENKSDDGTVWHNVTHKGNHVGTIGTNASQHQEKHGKWGFEDQSGNGRKQSEPKLNSKKEALNALINRHKGMKEEVEQVTESYGDMSHAAKELVLHADNHQHLYHSSHVPIMNNLRKKMKKGEYHPEKAKKLWAYHADRAAQSYAKEHGDGKPWHKMFSTADRKAAASHWEDMHRHELNEAKGPTSDYGLETFATNEEPVTPLSKAKEIARAAMSKIKNEMLGKAGATSEEIDPRIKTTDTLKGRIKGGKDDDVGPSATGRSTKVKFTPGPK